jgi:outer membrane receptor protein involved in Fe transport
MLSLGLFLLAAAAASSPENRPAAPDQPGVKEEVVVTAERGPEPREQIPAAVSVLTREEIDRLPAENLSELLDFLPGFHVLFPEEYGNPPIVSSRGFFGGGEAEYVQLLIDGVPVSDLESGLADWRRIRSADIERIEALRGPASSLYGDTALGGVVQIFTRSAGQLPAGSLALSGGSFATRSADFTLRRGLGALDLGLGATASRSDGFREHSQTDQQALDLSVGRSVGAGVWRLTLSGSSREREDPGPRTLEELRTDRFGSDALFRFDREETERGRMSLSYRHESPALDYTALIYGTLRETSLLRTLLIAAGVGDRAWRDLSSESVGGTLQGERTLSLFGRASELRAGLDLARESLDAAYRPVADDGSRGTEVASESGRRDRLALFLSHGWHLSARVRLTTGARWDRIADDFGAASRSRQEAWSPRLGLNWRLGSLGASPLVLFAQVSRAFKAPTLDQLFDPRPFPDFAGGSFTISNPNLKPQKAETIEAGVSRLADALSFELVAYRTEVRDEIDFDPATFQYRNIGKSRHVGIEASTRLFGRGPFSPSLSYEWTRVEPLEGDDRGTQLKNIPEHLVRAGLGAALPASLQAEVHYTWMGGRFLDDPNRIPLADASVLDLRLQRAFGGVRVRLDLLNLTDEEYEQFGFALPDFTGGVAAYYLPGAGFAARAGIDWGF